MHSDLFGIAFPVDGEIVIRLGKQVVDFAVGKVVPIAEIQDLDERLEIGGVFSRSRPLRSLGKIPAGKAMLNKNSYGFLDGWVS